MNPNKIVAAWGNWTVPGNRVGVQTANGKKYLATIPEFTTAYSTPTLLSQLKNVQEVR